MTWSQNCQALIPSSRHCELLVVCASDDFLISCATSETQAYRNEEECETRDRSGRWRGFEVLEDAFEALHSPPSLAGQSIASFLGKHVPDNIELHSSKCCETF